jgi:hypothetical protein
MSSAERISACHDLGTDAESKRPIPAAEVRISPYSRSSFTALSPSRDTTRDDGMAHLWCDPSAEIGITVEATAEGDEAEPSGWFPAIDPRPADVVTEQYAPASTNTRRHTQGLFGATAWYERST